MSVRADELARVRSPGGAPAGSLLRAYGFRRLLIGQSVSSLGDWVATLAFIAAAFALTNGDQAAIAVVLVLRLVPPIFAAPLGGVVADRLSRRTLVLASVFDSATFLFSAAMNAGLPLGRGARHSELQLFRDLLEGVRYIVRHPALRSLSYGLVVSMFGGGVLFAVGIGYVHQTLGGSDAAFGWLGALCLLPGGGRPREFLAAVVACGLVLGLMAMAPVLWMAFVAAVVFGMAFAVAIVLALTMTQEQADNRVRGRVMGGVQMLFRAGLGLGALGIGWLAHAAGELSLPVDGNQVGLLAGAVLILLGAAAAGGVLRQRPS